MSSYPLPSAAAKRPSPVFERVDVEVRSFAALFSDAPLPLDIDSYQRPYVWGEEKSVQLLSDLGEHLAGGDTQQEYYMGTILLHRGGQRLFVIDGQQRLTTLCLLHRQLHSGLPGNCKLSYRNPESWRNIRRTAALFRTKAGSLPARDVFSRICFTVVVVDSEDLAFTFFDTQNNRGVPLAATDLLKAYHLRAIGGVGENIVMQKNCAARWEALQNRTSINGEGNDFAPFLFNRILWRSRCWSGTAFGANASHDQLLEEFATRSLRPKTGERGRQSGVPLYASRLNRYASVLTVTPDGALVLHSEEQFSAKGGGDLPFSIRQPVSAGVGFFLFAEKYASVADELLVSDNHSPEIRAFRRLHAAVISQVSHYLSDFFVLACIMFLDQLGSRKLFEFALWLDYSIGAIRMKKSAIYKEAPMNFLKDQPRNLLDVIASAYRAEDVVAYLSSLSEPYHIYKNTILKTDGVQRRYERSVLVYYQRADVGNGAWLAGRENWILEKLQTELPHEYPLGSHHLK